MYSPSHLSIISVVFGCQNYTLDDLGISDLWHFTLSGCLNKVNFLCFTSVVLNLFILQPFNIVPHIVVSHNIISSLFHNCNFATVRNDQVNIWCVGNLLCNPCERVDQLPSPQDPHVENHWFRNT